MIKLRNIASNVNMIDLGLIDVYFSYETPVAVVDWNKGMFHTNKYYSHTTSRHVNIITEGMDSVAISQERLEEMIRDELQR